MSLFDVDDLDLPQRHDDAGKARSDETEPGLTIAGPWCDECGTEMWLMPPTGPDRFCRHVRSPQF